MESSQFENPTPHMILELETVEKHLHSARATHLIIIVICGFLFLIIFNLVFGWQIIRPAASRKFFANNLANLALAKQFIGKDTLNLSPFAQGILQIAEKHCFYILCGDTLCFHDSMCVIFFRNLTEKFDSSLSKDTVSQREEIISLLIGELAQNLNDSLYKNPVWFQEEHVRLFVEDVEYFEAGLQKRFEKKVVACSPLDTLTQFLNSLLSDSLRHGELEHDKDSNICLSYADTKKLINDIKRLPETGLQIDTSLIVLAHNLAILSSKDSGWHKGYIQFPLRDAKNIETNLQILHKEDLSGSSGRKSDTHISMAYVDNQHLPPFISFHLQEIKDRFRVNEETRGRRVSPRERAFPITGTMVQIEDMGVPIAVFLVVLTYWWYCTVRKAFESTHRYLIENKKTVSGDKKESKSKEERAQEVLYRYLFIEIVDDDRSDTNHILPKTHIRWGIIALFLAPYLVIMSNFLATLHETALLDIRYHATEFHVESSTIYAFNFFSILLFFLAVFLAYLGWRMSSHYIDIHNELSKTLHPNEDFEKSYNQKKERASHLFLWTLIAPFSIFGSFSTLYFAGGIFQKDYFPYGLNLWAYVIFVSIFLFCTILLFSKREIIQSYAPMYWLLLGILIVSVSLISLVKNHWGVHFSPFPNPSSLAQLTIICLLGAALFAQYRDYTCKMYGKLSNKLIRLMCREAPGE